MEPGLKQEAIRMENFMEENLKHWNEVTPIHAKSEFYDVEGFKSGRCTLMPVEREELGEVAGKTLLHLQCHFGMDTMSWARLGAKVTGVDFSEKAIDLAKSLSRELGIEAEFLCSNIYNLPRVLKKKYEIVFTSYGILCWIPDLKRWAEIIAHFLQPGGTFYIAESHPFNVVFENERNTTQLKVRYSYFHAPQPTKWEGEGTYADKDARVINPTFEWTHPLSDIINALISAGLKIEFLHEFPYCGEDHFPFMEKGQDGWWRLKDGKETIPLMFSLKATKLTP
jgi:2-polyprenyl-3-methyl-5-hydroxy-6-metoxy-1,4-benzoquinol methylase